MSLFCSSYLQLSNRDRYSSYSQKQLLGDTSPQTDCLSAADCETSHNIKEQSGTDRICLPQNDGNVTQYPCEWTLAGVFLVLLSPPRFQIFAELEMFGIFLSNTYFINEGRVCSRGLSGFWRRSQERNG